jgi:hypothetical protein
MLILTILMQVAAIPKMPVHKKSNKFWVITGENSMACVQVDFVQVFITRISKKIQFLYYTYIAKIKANAALRFRPIRFVSYLYAWSQSAPSSEKGPIKR